MIHDKGLRRLLALTLSLALMFSLCLPVLAAEDGTIYLRTAEDLAALSEKCSLDTWSTGKTVVLVNDISLKGMDFEPIAVFSGTFDGGGHTISGLHVSGGYSPAGLFSVLREGAEVHSLTVTGTVDPSGDAEEVGGIAGRNYGTIRSCTFSGTVGGSSYAGGIVGRNEESGGIVSCTVRGSVAAKLATGGIAGYNLGLLRGCTSAASVNTETEEDAVLSLDDISLDPAASIEDIPAINAAQNDSAASDTGGIVGCSCGRVFSCINQGEVGYPHVGYNVGGIAGRSDDLISGCENRGAVYGRKDVGGVVGQLEPSLHTTARSDRLSRLRGELKTLNRLLNVAINDAESTGDQVSARLDAISDHASAAVDSADDLADRTTDFIDANIGSANDLADRIDYAMDELPDILRAFEDSSDALSDAIDDLERCARGLKMSASDRTELDKYINELRENNDSLKSAVADLKKCLSELSDAVKGGADTDELRAIFKKTVEALKTVRNAANQALSGFVENNVKITELLARYLKDALPKTRADLENAISGLGSASDALSDALKMTRDMIENINDRDDVAFTPLDEDYETELDGLFDHLRGTMDELDALNGDLSDGSDTLASDLRAVNDQFNVVFDLALDLLTDIEDADASDLYEDVSEDNIEETEDGKVCESVNYGSVQADLNVGGIVGAMAVEHELDREDDDEEENASLFNRTYQARAVVQRCVNHGEITAKKDCAGGIVGQMNIGVVTSSEAYGRIESESGDYVGGIAGLSVSAIHLSWAKCTLSGKSCVGGILGAASNRTHEDNTCKVTDCRSLVSIEECERYGGAIVGREGAVLSGNFFVSDTLRGIDRRSIAGQAEPVSYEQFCTLSDVPEDFLSFSLRFVCDDVTLKEVSFHYGESFDATVYPNIPNQEGSYHKWEDVPLTDLRFDTVVHAVYYTFDGAIESDAAREDGRPVFFVEGQFQNGDTLTAAAEAAEPDELERIAVKCPTPTLTVYRALEETWALRFPHDALASHTVRFLPKDGSSHYAVFIREEGGEWKRVETGTFGSYLTFSADGVEIEVAVVRTGAAWQLWVLVSALLAALILVLRIWRRRRVAQPKLGSDRGNDAEVPKLPE